MSTNNSSSTFSGISIRNAALTAGFGLLLMVLTAPVAEMYLLPNLVDFKDASATYQNLMENRQVFITVIFLYMTTFFADVIVAWALYIFFKPFNQALSLLTAWFRLVYTVLAIYGLFNLLKVLELMDMASEMDASISAEVSSQLMFYLKSFGSEWGIAFVFFGIYLGLLGYLAYKAKYVPKIIGILLLIAGIGYFVSSLKPYFFPQLDTSFVMITFIGELVFMVWLLISGFRKASSLSQFD